jgi:hypothetical protein
MERPFVMYRRQFVRRAAVGLSLGVGGCVGGGGGDAETPTPTATPTETTAGALSLTSPAFSDGGTIPERFTCAGANVSPRLDVSGVHEDATSLALLVDDPDAPTAEPFVHWLLWNVPVDRKTIPEGVEQGDTVDALDGARQGTNSAGQVGYAGPCPPTEDGAHTYRFDLVALDSRLDVDPGANRDALESGMNGHVLASARLTGEFDRN